MRSEAMATRTTPSRTSGIREFTLTISITVRVGSLREMILTAGRRLRPRVIRVPDRIAPHHPGYTSAMPPIGGTRHPEP